MHQLAASLNRRPSVRAFTLIELLVVISIITVLLSIILPALMASKKTALLVDCMARERQLITAVNAYLPDHDHTTPKATYANGASGISPSATGQVPGSSLGSGFQVWDSIGGALKNYLAGDPRKIWRDPAAAYLGPDDAWTYTGPNPLSGIAANDRFHPNYFYMATANWITITPNQSWFPQIWSTRNIANLKIGALRQSASNTLIFVDESTSQHTGTTDIYHRYANHIAATDHDNFAYLDGHVATKTFTDLHGYLADLPGPIPQSQFGINFQSTAAWLLANIMPPPLK